MFCAKSNTCEVLPEEEEQEDHNQGDPHPKNTETAYGFIKNSVQEAFWLFFVVIV